MTSKLPVPRKETEVKKKTVSEVKPHKKQRDNDGNCNSQHSTRKTAFAPDLYLKQRGN